MFFLKKRRWCGWWFGDEVGGAKAGVFGRVDGREIFHLVNVYTPKIQRNAKNTWVKKKVFAASNMTSFRGIFLLHPGFFHGKFSSEN